MKKTIKLLQETIRASYTDTVNALKATYPDLAISPTISLTEDQFNTICAKHGVTIQFTSDNNDQVIIRRSLDRKEIKVVPNDLMPPKNDDAKRIAGQVSTYDAFQATEVKVTDIRNRIKQLDTGLADIIRRSQTRKVVEKIKIDDKLINDTAFIATLFVGCDYLLCPASFSKRIRDRLSPFFVRIHNTDYANGKLIGVGDTKTVYGFIISA